VSAITIMPIDIELRLRVLRLLSEQPRISQRSLARALGLSVGKVNYCLHALMDKGWVKARNFRNSNNKLAYAYALTPTGIRARALATLAFLEHKQREYRELEREIAALRVEAATIRLEPLGRASDKDLLA